MLRTLQAGAHAKKLFFRNDESFSEKGATPSLTMKISGDESNPLAFMCVCASATRRRFFSQKNGHIRPEIFLAMKISSLTKQIFSASPFDDFTSSEWITIYHDDPSQLSWWVAFCFYRVFCSQKPKHRQPVGDQTQKHNFFSSRNEWNFN